MIPVTSIKEFFNYKNNECFFCKQELDITLGARGATTIVFELKDDILTASSRFVNFSINIIENTIEVPDKIGVELYLFLSNQSLTVDKQCLNCEDIFNSALGKYYQINAEFKFESNTNIVKPLAYMREYLCVPAKFSLTSHLHHDVSVLGLWAQSDSGAPLYTKLRYINLPLIDISNISYEKLLEKIKTYTLLS